MLKPNKYSVGYRQCDEDYQYKEELISVEEGMQIYITTDGFLDQNGGEKDFPFGKKRFQQIINDNVGNPMSSQKDTFLAMLKEYQEMVEDNERNDDITVIGLKI